jgi:hypothetical protein
MLTFVNGHCCPLPSSYNGSVFWSLLEAIQKLTFLELHVGWSAVVHEFHEHPQNKAFIAAVSFSETRTEMGPKSASKEGAGATLMFQTAKHCWQFCPVVSNRGADFTRIHHIVKSFWEVAGTFPHKKLILPVISKTGMSLAFVEDFVKFLHIFSPWFSLIRFKKPTQTLLSSPCGIVIKSCS